MRFYLVSVSTSGYHCRSAFSAESLADAARVHLDAYRASRTSSAIVLRSANGRRYSVSDSVKNARDGS